MMDKLDAELRFNQEALSMRARRQDILANNIANADTPNFKARDVAFAAELQRALDDGRGAAGGLALATTSARHVQGGTTLGTGADLLYRVPAQPSVDGNTVEMDTERANFADNALHYEAGLTVVSSRLKSLLAALQQ